MVMERILYERIKALRRPLVVGINGTYTSGKTIFTDSLAEYLCGQGVKTQVIHYDDFHRPFDTIAWMDAADEVEVFYNRAFDPEKLVMEVLRPLRAAGSIHEDVACVNLGTGQFDNIVRLDIGDDTVVLLEGVLLFRPPILPYLDYKVYLDISTDEVLRRAEMRDVPRFGAAILEKFPSRYMPVQARYIAECDPIGASDLVIDNNDCLSPKLLK